MTRLHLENALVDGKVLADVAVDVDADGRITAVSPGTARTADHVALDGLALPGFANAHSHAFHRLLRGRTDADGDDFWAWRDLMYRAAGRLDPDRYHSLARALFAELLEAGYTAVGEFHYLHRRPDGAAYAPHGAMAQALADAARGVGIRLTLLHTAYLRGGLDEHGNPLTGSDAQRPFLDTAREWRDRHEELAAITGPLVRRGAALHSLRAVDPADLPALLEAADSDEPLHAHVSEQPAENAQVGAAYGASPVEVLARAGGAVAAIHRGPCDPPQPRRRPPARRIRLDGVHVPVNGARPRRRHRPRARTGRCGGRTRRWLRSTRRRRPVRRVPPTRGPRAPCHRAAFAL
ncbi:MAG: amidohydrolase family protein [Demequina sp.]|nr:amidohydrolase family protein [Demequina sp.]